MRTGLFIFCFSALLFFLPIGACRMDEDSVRPEERVSSQEKPYLMKRILIINYDPLVPAEKGERLTRKCGWNDPDALAREYTEEIQKITGGYVRYVLIEGVTLNKFPVKKDGFQYTPEEYMECFQRGGQWHEQDAVDYSAIVKKFELVRKVETGDIDEVWLFGGPYFGYYESIMVGTGAYFCNAPPMNEVKCSKPFVIMGFNYERGVGEMLENLGHRAESILTHVFKGWEAGKERTPWERFTLYDKVAPGRAACGNVHFAPNSEEDYDWGNQRTVWSTCDDWLDYPNLKGNKKKVNCSEWGGGDILAHHRWWLRHIPRASGKSEGKQNNWWKYIIDPCRYPESR